MIRVSIKPKTWSRYIASNVVHTTTGRPWWSCTSMAISLPQFSGSIAGACLLSICPFFGMLLAAMSWRHPIFLSSRCSDFDKRFLWDWLTYRTVDLYHVPFLLSATPSKQSSPLWLPHITAIYKFNDLVINILRTTSIASEGGTQQLTCTDFLFHPFLFFSCWSPDFGPSLRRIGVRR